MVETNESIPAESPATILIVDDMPVNRQMLSDLTRMLGHQPVTAKDGAEALAEMRRRSVDIVLLDIMMPVMGGYEVLEQMRADPSLQHIPVVVISGLDDMDSVVRCLEHGAEDYLLKPFNQVVLRARVKAGLYKKRQHDQELAYRQQIEDYNRTLQARVEEQVREISSAQMATIFALANLADSRDPETGAHLLRMREYARILSQRLVGHPQYSRLIDSAFIETVYAAAPLHDIGKVGIPDRILQKPAELTPEEFAIMKVHTTIGATTLRAVHEQHPRNAFIRMGIDIAESHHERWDGRGYPLGRVAEDIPLSGRIVALSDVYDALTSKRCYKEAFSHEESRDIIAEGRGTQFDPIVTDAFLAAEQEFAAVREKHRDLEKAVLV